MTSAAPSGAPPAADFGEGDLGIVNYALTLEYLEADFYATALKSGIFTGTKYATYAPTLTIIGRHEADQIVALRGVAQKLGTPAKKPKTDWAGPARGSPARCPTSSSESSPTARSRWAPRRTRS